MLVYLFLLMFVVVFYCVIVKREDPIAGSTLAANTLYSFWLC